MDLEAELAAELERIQELPIVLNVTVLGKTSSALNAMRVRASLKAEFVQEDNRRRPVIACSLERPTLVMAAKTLREKILSDYSSELEAAALEGSDAPEKPKAAGTAFDALRAGARAHNQLQTAARVAEERLREANEALLQAQRGREEAAEKAEAAREQLEKFEKSSAPSHKRQRTGPLTALQAAAKMMRTASPKTQLCRPIIGTAGPSPNGESWSERARMRERFQSPSM